MAKVLRASFKFKISRLNLKRIIINGDVAQLARALDWQSRGRSGAIEIFKRTGSITKLQKAMGHSSINVSLTYLRGLEIAELKEEDMPMV